MNDKLLHIPTAVKELEQKSVDLDWAGYPKDARLALQRAQTLKQYANDFETDFYPLF